MNRRRVLSQPMGAILAVILVAYLIIGTLFAVYTPAWQVPDEPAHYNYVRALVEERRLPVLQMGDYPHDYLEQIKARGFPPDMSIASIRYEFHQPPLYYLLAAPVFAVTRGALLPLRLFSLLLGAGVILLAYAAVKALFPDRPPLALATAAFVAFLPQHVAMMAGVENDSLAELILAAVLWQLLLFVHDQGKNQSRRRAAILGILIGLGLLTKTTDYLALPLVALALGLRWRQDRTDARRLAFLIFGLALLIGLPWWMRDQAVYGGLDLLGLGRHDWVVNGQPRTAEWLATYGVAGFARRFVQTTFQSFWGQFGWMGVVLDQRIYAGLALMSGLVGLGLALRLADMLFSSHPLCLLSRRVREEGSRSLSSGLGRGGWGMEVEPGQADGLILMAALVLLTVATYLWYNTKFVQHQGRYLFPALIPIGLAVAIGLRRLLQPDGARLAAGLLGAGWLGLAGFGLVHANLSKGLLLFVAVLIVGMAMAGWGRRSLTWLAVAAFYVGMAAFDGIALFRFILPALR